MKNEQLTAYFCARVSGRAEARGDGVRTSTMMFAIHSWYSDLPPASRAEPRAETAETAVPMAVFASPWNTDGATAHTGAVLP